MSVAAKSHGPLRGHIDEMRMDGESMIISGWMCSPSAEFTEMRLVMDGATQARHDPIPRPDVAQINPLLPNAVKSGFRFHIHPPQGAGRLEIEGLKGGRPVARIRSFYRTDLDAAVPSPPAHLISRVTGGPYLGFFKADGLRTFTEFRDALARHARGDAVHRMLDWGCGCGRLAAHFSMDPIVREVHGCDIDGEAIAWCRDNLTAATFRHIDPAPPTPYADGMFDLVIGYSVFTHLTRDMQLAWLAELRRILAPGGLLLTSVLGDFAASFHAGFVADKPKTFRDRARRLLRGHFLDVGADPWLDGIAPDGYYRDVFQTRRHTEREWSRVLDVVEYVEGGLQGYQDLVVMRRPSR